MSRIGLRKLDIPEGVQITVDGNSVKVVGPKGELSTVVNENITVKQEDNKVVVERKSDAYKKFHGTANAIIKNMIEGVTKGFEKKLEIVGVGYRFQVAGNKLTVNAGYSHPVIVEAPKGITLESPSNTELTIKGIDKAAVGKFAAEIRDIRKPEPYKGKGIRYAGEHINRKVGKKAA